MTSTVAVCTDSSRDSLLFLARSAASIHGEASGQSHPRIAVGEILAHGTFQGVRVSFDLMADLEGLYRRHVGAAMKAAWLVSADAAMADELVQEAFVRCAGRIGQLRDPTAFGGYWQKAVLRLAANDARSRLYERRLSERLAARQATDSVRDPAADSDSRLLLSEALDGLPVRQRAVLIARFYLDLSEADTATALGMRLGTVKSTCARALKAMRALMAGEAI